MANWYVKRGSQIAGPLTRERLNQLAAEGKVQKTDLVREGEEGEFHPASDVNDLFTGSESPAWDEFEAGPETQPQPSHAAPKKSNTTLIVILAVIGVGGIFMVMVLVALLLPAVEQAREAARRSTSKNNLKQIGLALHNYYDTYGVFPPGGTQTTDGVPYQGWSTSILPFVDQAPLYNRIDFDQPWNAPDNIDYFKQEIPVYLNPNIEERVSPEGLGLSHYVGNELVMKLNYGLGIRNISDGTSNTILAFEVGENFKPWGDPTNIALPADRMGPGNKPAFRGGSHVLLGDGSVRFVSENIDPAILKKLETPGGGEFIGEF
tara:strand:+ start:396 stop:1355 length:960 start_codon:yes stop_codon:yes gene_type:complete